MPADDGVGLDDDEGIPPIIEKAAQKRHSQARRVTGAPGASPTFHKQRDLPAKNEVLRSEGLLAVE